MCDLHQSAFGPKRSELTVIQKFRLHFGPLVVGPHVEGLLQGKERRCTHEDRLTMNLRSVYVVTSWDDADKFTAKLTRLLENYELKATFFVPIKSTKHSRLSKGEIAALSDAYEIGSHSMTHSNLTKAPLEVVRKEVLESKQVLERIIGTDILCFCYPGGFFNGVVRNEVKAAGYIAARTSKTYRIDESTDPFRMSTTIQARRQTKLSLNLFALANISLALVSVLLTSQKWSKLAKKLFDICLKRGGVFHLWGHAWEIEKQSGWNTLEDIFSHISYRKDVSYLSMGEYVKKVCARSRR